MLVHLTRCSFPADLSDYRLQVKEFGQSTLEDLLELSDISGWSLPASSMAGHPVWFQVTASSIKQGKACLGEARTRGTKGEVRDLERLQRVIEAHAGRVISVGRITGSAVAGRGVDKHFRGRIFAPVADLTVLSHPVPADARSDLSELSPFAHAAAQRTNRLVGSDEEYERMLAIVEQAGNRIPKWARVRINASDDWVEVANETGANWIDEDQLKGQFGIPLARELSDNRRVITEVRAQPDRVKKRSRCMVDGLIQVGGVPLPVEYKLSRRAESDLAGQLVQYAGPGVFDKKGKRTTRSWRTEHPYVLVIDGEGMFVYSGGEPAGGVKSPLLRRGKINNQSILEARECLESLLTA